MAGPSLSQHAHAPALHAPTPLPATSPSPFNGRTLSFMGSTSRPCTPPPPPATLDRRARARDTGGLCACVPACQLAAQPSASPPQPAAGTPTTIAPASSFFLQVIVDQIPPNVLVSNCATATYDFAAIQEAELFDIRIPLSLQVAVPCTGARGGVGHGGRAGGVLCVGALPAAGRPARTAGSRRSCPCHHPPLLLQCTAWRPGSMCCLMARRASAGCLRRQACPSPTGAQQQSRGRVAGVPAPSGRAGCCCSGPGRAASCTGGWCLQPLSASATETGPNARPPNHPAPAAMPPCCPQVPAALPARAARRGGAAGGHRARRAAPGGTRTAKLRRSPHAASAAADARRPAAGARAGGGARACWD